MAQCRQPKRIKRLVLTGVTVFLPCLLLFQLCRELSVTAADGSIRIVSQEVREALSPMTGFFSFREEGLVKTAGGLLNLDAWIFRESATEALPRVQSQAVAARTLQNVLTSRGNASAAAGMSSCNSTWPDILQSAERVNESLTRPSAYDDLFRLSYMAKPRSQREEINEHQTLDQTLDEREQSFQVSSSMRVHCGFLTNGLAVSHEDRAEMDSCTGVVVITAVFDGYDLLRQPAHEVGQESYGPSLLCFFAFADNETIQYWAAHHIISDHQSIRAGIWRIIQVKQLPYSDPTISGRVFKHLPHRIFPGARYSVWLDGKLLLKMHPLVMVDTFLLQTGRPFALSEHPDRVDILEEATAAKKHRPKFAAAIDEQMAFYVSEGFDLRFEEGQIGRGNTIGTDTDLTDSSLIIREHNPLVNLFSCLWYNEIDRFHPRDQLSFGYVRRRLSLAVPMYLFPHCLRDDCVELIGHVYEDKGCGKPREVPILSDIDIKQSGALVYTDCPAFNKTESVL